MVPGYFLTLHKQGHCKWQTAGHLVAGILQFLCEATSSQHECIMASSLNGAKHVGNQSIGSYQILHRQRKLFHYTLKHKENTFKHKSNLEFDAMHSFVYTEHYSLISLWLRNWSKTSAINKTLTITEGCSFSKNSSREDFWVTPNPIKWWQKIFEISVHVVNDVWTGKM